MKKNASRQIRSPRSSGVSGASALFSTSLFVMGLTVPSVQAPAATASSASWQRRLVPGAQCGNGDPYAIDIRLGRSDRLAFEMRGGGACWNALTCYGPAPLAQMALPATDDRDGLSSPLPDESPLADATYVSMPYCTGDIHVGRHEAQYGRKTVQHMGGENLERVLEFLDKEWNLFTTVVEFTAVGQSAGALGVLLNLPQFDRYLDSGTRRVAIVDSPGLHFGRQFWERFPEPWFGDVAQAMSSVGAVADRQNGFIAPELRSICGRFSHWDIGILQSTRDTVMSLVFGSISPSAHERLVLSSSGVSELARNPEGHCAIWVHDSARHTFTGKSSDRSSETKGVSGFRFASDLIAGSGVPSVIP